MFYQLISYLTFILKSKNQHGVHSPFVFDLVTKCLYNSKKKVGHTPINEIYKDTEAKLSLKHTMLFFRILEYLDVNNILLLGDQAKEMIPFLKIKPTIAIHTKPNTPGIRYDSIYLDPIELSKKNTIISELVPSVHNDSILIVPKPYTNRSTEKAWRFLTNHQGVTVSINTFYFGFIFFRKEQGKEYFSIRL